MRDTSTNGIVSTGRLNGSPFAPSGNTALQVISSYMVTFWKFMRVCLKDGRFITLFQGHT